MNKFFLTYIFYLQDSDENRFVYLQPYTDGDQIVVLSSNNILSNIEV